MRWLPSRHTRPVRLAKDEERSLPTATSENANVLRWRCQTRLEGLSIGSPCATRKRWRRIPGVVAWACDRHQACEDKRESLTAAGEESMAQPSPKTHLRQSMT